MGSPRVRERRLETEEEVEEERGLECVKVALPSLAEGAAALE